MEVTRLAPSPTGALHLGNARTFLINWLLARRGGWQIILRIEDIDGPRIKRDAASAAIEDLRWLGLDWDGEPIAQSTRADRYETAIEQLLRQRLAYPCVCSRREAALAGSAPHAEDGAGVYPGTCRDRFGSIEQARRESGREPAVRFRVPASPVSFIDRFRGQIEFGNIERQLGDFIIRKADGSPAYQIAVVVDDAEMRVTQIIRGDDLIDSTPRQLLLYDALKMSERIPQYTHLPLVIGPDGRRLAKRHGDTRLSHYRSVGVRPGRILALLARWSGISVDQEISLSELLTQFDLGNLPRHAITMMPEDERWLMEGA